MTRLAVVLSHPTQYYSPWFRHLSAEPTLELKVFYLWDFGVRPNLDVKFQRTVAWDVDLLSGYQSEFIPNRAPSPGPQHFSGFRNPSLIPQLQAFGPQVILLFGYRYRTHIHLILQARRLGWPLLFRGDSHLIDQPNPRWLKQTILRQIFSRFAAVTFVGKANRDYFRRFEVPEQKLFHVPHCVDQTLFDPTQPQHADEAMALRVEIGLPTDARVAVFVGKLQPEKQPLALAQAFSKTTAKNWHLLVVGDGHQDVAIRQWASDHPTRPIHRLPFVNQSRIPAVYQLADLLVLPSIGLTETWGLSVNEAMHMGCPALVSHRVGCHADMIVPGKTGWVFDAAKPHTLSDSLESAMQDVAIDRSGFRDRTIAHASHFSYEIATQGLLKAVDSIALSP